MLHRPNFTEVHTALVDRQRVREISEHERRRVERQFAPAKARAAAARAAMATASKTALAWA